MSNHPRPEHFTVEDLYVRVAEKANVPTDKVQYLHLHKATALALEVLCEEINEIKRELRKKI